MHVVHFDTAEEAAIVAARIIAGCARDAVEERGEFHVALSGGRAPWTMIRALREEEVPWAKTHIHQVDERLVDADSPDRNWTRILECLDGAPAQLHPLPVEEILAGGDERDACARYAADLPDQLDMVHLGLGTDGHTASLVPDDPVLDVTESSVALTVGEYQGTRRITLTLPVLSASRNVLWLVTGDGKEHALEQLLAASSDIPAGHVEQKRAMVFTDQHGDC